MQHSIEPQDLLYVALLIGLWWVKLTYGLWRRTKYLDELLRREQQKRIADANEIQTRLLKLFFKEQEPTLKTLVDDSESGFKLKR